VFNRILFPAFMDLNNTSGGLTAASRLSTAHDRLTGANHVQGPPLRPTLADMPPEIHLLIANQLLYPDRLALKHASRYFYWIVDTGVKVKVDWLVWRRMLHLKCPNHVRCDLGSDLKFCRGSVS